MALPGYLHTSHLWSPISHSSGSHRLLPWGIQARALSWEQGRSRAREDLGDSPCLVTGEVERGGIHTFHLLPRKPELVKQREAVFRSQRLQHPQGQMLQSFPKR